MKKALLLVFAFFLLNKIQAQTVFCPLGAEWHYTFYREKPGPVTNKIIYNEPVKYVRDSLLDMESVKVLSHTYFFTGTCATLVASPTAIKQKGDTIFMRNANTQHSWQILYNFAAQPGDSWQCNTYGASNYNTYIKTVDSVGHVTLNGFNLKRLYVTASITGHWAQYQEIITERLGSNSFFFHFYTDNCDGPGNYDRNLCYRDNSFGLIQHTTLPCNYSTALYTGMSENKYSVQIEFYPNPANTLLYIDREFQEDLEVSFVDILGREVKRMVLSESNTLDVADLNAGVYQIVVYKNTNAVYKTKIIKE